MPRKKKVRNAVIILAAAGVGWLFYTGVFSAREAGWLGRRLFYGGAGAVSGLRKTPSGSGNYAQAAACRENLRAIEMAKRRVAGDSGAAAGYVGKDEILKALGGKFPVCPSGGAYTINALLQLPTCSLRDCGTPLDPEDDHVIVKF